MEVYSKRVRVVAQSEASLNDDCAKRARLCDSLKSGANPEESKTTLSNIIQQPLMETVNQLSQSMDSVNTATGEEEVSFHQIVSCQHWLNKCSYLCFHLFYLVIVFVCLL